MFPYLQQSSWGFFVPANALWGEDGHAFVTTTNEHISRAFISDVDRVRGSVRVAAGTGIFATGADHAGVRGGVFCRRA